MADNVTLDAGTGGAVISTEEITTLNGSAGQDAQHVQRMLLAYRVGDGSASDLAIGGGVEAGSLRVTIANDSTGVLSVDDGGGSLTVDVGSIAAGDNNIGNVDVASSALPTGASTAANQTTIIGHLDGVEGLLTTIDADTGTLAGAVSGTEMQVDVVAALPTGDNNIGNVDIASIAAGDNNIGNVDIASAIPAGNNNIGDVDVASIAAGTNTIGNVGVVPRTSGGLTIFRSLDLDETEEEIKATAGQLFGWYIYNDGAADVSVKLYNATTANVTVGTTTPVMTLTIPAGAAANAFNAMGIAFSTAITAAAVTEIADNGTTAPAANQVVANFFYA